MSKDLKMFNMTLVEIAKEDLAKLKSKDRVKNTIRETVRDEFQEIVLEFIKKFIKSYNDKNVAYLKFDTDSGITSPGFDNYLDMIDDYKEDLGYIKSSWELITEEFWKETQKVVNTLTNDSIRVRASVQFEENELNILLPTIRLVLERK